MPCSRAELCAFTRTESRRGSLPGSPRIWTYACSLAVRSAPAATFRSYGQEPLLRAFADGRATTLTQGGDVVAGLGLVGPPLDHLVGDGGSIDRLVSHRNNVIRNRRPIGTPTHQKVGAPTPWLRPRCMVIAPAPQSVGNRKESDSDAVLLNNEPVADVVTTSIRRWPRRFRWGCPVGRQRDCATSRRESARSTGHAPHRSELRRMRTSRSTFCYSTFAS
jgi:hypothetical protein